MSYNEFYGAKSALRGAKPEGNGTIRQFIVDAVTFAGVIAIASVALIFAGAFLT